MKKLALLLGSFFIPLLASAHVGYVIPHDEMVIHTGEDIPFLFSVFHNPFYVFLMLATAIVVVLLVIYVPKISAVKAWFLQIEERMSSYGDFLPWMARLSVGIALIGAGSAHVLVSPLTPALDGFAFLELVLGFAWLAGFLLIPVALATIFLYLVALVGEVYILGNLDFLALSVAFLSLHSERPGIDDIFGFKMLYGFRLPRSWAPFILRIGIGIGMAYLALYEKLLNPHLSELVVSEFHLTSVVHVSPAMWIFGAGCIELMVAICLLFGFYTRLTSVIAFLVLVTTFFFFKEAVYSHVTLFGLLSILFVTGGGVWSLDALRQKKRERKELQKTYTEMILGK
jgi:uncharacterized membrane protein YphA (DoxX/SURF4 family)